MKRSLDSFRQYDGCVLFPQTIVQDLRWCLSGSRCVSCQTCSSGTDTGENTAPDELRRTDGLHPTGCKGVEMAHEVQQTQLTLSLHPETSTQMWTECIIEHGEQHATIEIASSGIFWFGCERGYMQRTLPRRKNALSLPTQRLDLPDGFGRPYRRRHLGAQEVPRQHCQGGL